MWFLSLLSGGLVGQIGRELNAAYKSSLDAKNETDRIDADIRIETLTSQRDILVAEQKDRLTKWIRPFIAAPFGIYIWKIVVWDKVLSLGITDPLSVEMYAVMGTVIGAYFLGRPWEKRKK